MTIHYTIESLNDLFISDKYLLDMKDYNLQGTQVLQSIEIFLNSIEINKQYYRTGIVVKNPKYKKNISNDSNILKLFKTSLNKLSSVNYININNLLVDKLTNKKHLYPLIFEIIFEQALLHHTYSKYYCHLVNLLDIKFNSKELIINQISKVYQEIEMNSINENSEYSKLCSTNKKTDQLIGYSMFLCELEVQGLIQNKIDPLIITVLDKMINDLSDKIPNEDDMYKCVMCLYTLCKQKYGINTIPDIYIQKIELLKDTKLMKVRFKLMDIIERC